MLCTRLKALFPSLGVLRRSGLLGVCQAYGFRDMGVFLDWASLFQKDPRLWTEAELVTEERRTEDQRHAAELYRDSRTQAQGQATKFALDHTMDLWYAHSKTTVVLLTELPEKLPESFDEKRTYKSRGWTMFERCSAELGKTFHLQQAGWSLVIDLGEQRAALRRLPTTPERMEELMLSQGVFIIACPALYGCMAFAQGVFIIACPALYGCMAFAAAVRGCHGA